MWNIKKKKKKYKQNLSKKKKKENLEQSSKAIQTTDARSQNDYINTNQNNF